MYEDNEQRSRLARRQQILIVLLLGAGTGLLLLPPIPQDQAYHLFADQRVVFGIPPAFYRFRTAAADAK